jgi:uncharacterized protein YbcI
MNEGTTTTAAERIAQAATAFQQECTGHGPGSVSVLLGEGTLVVTLHDVLSPAEREMARTPEGAGKIHEFHQQLFQTSAMVLHHEIERILGLQVLESTEEIERAGGSVMKVFASGAMVQVFRLSRATPTQSWSTPSVTRNRNPSD